MIPQSGSKIFHLPRRALVISGLLILATLLTLAQSKSNTTARKAAPRAKTLSVAQWNNLGVAYMDQQRLDDAHAAVDQDVARARRLQLCDDVCGRGVD